MTHLSRAIEAGARAIQELMGPYVGTPEEIAKF